jgi:hypothetical protein
MCNYLVAILRHNPMRHHAISSATVDRHSLVPFLRSAIAAAEVLPRAGLHRRLAAPAGIPLDLWFDNEAEAELLAPRLADVEPDAGQDSRTRLYMLSGASIGHASLPAWSGAENEAAEFHPVLAEAGLRAAHPAYTRAWHVLDLAAGVGLQLANSPSDLPAWFAGAPLRQHLHWLLRARGWRIAHAATLGLHGRGILLLGNGGAGKSGTTLAGLAAGLRTVGDDYIALGGTDPAIARPLFRIAKQDRAGLARIPGLAERLAHLPANWMNKVEFDPAIVFPGCFTDALRLDAIVMPRLARAAVPRFMPATAGDAMRTLIPTNLHQFPGEPIDGLDYYGALVRPLPVHWLELSGNAADNGAALADFVASLV